MTQLQALVNEEEVQATVDLTGNLGDLAPAYFEFCRRVARGPAATRPSAEHSFDTLRQSLMNGTPFTTEELALRFSQAVILDLAEQGWKITTNKRQVLAVPPSIKREDKASAKQVIRTTHLFGRDVQLKEKSVRQFILDMERPRLTMRGWHSIFSLMRDGSDLAASLRGATSFDIEEERASELSKIISPYLQFVEKDSLCEHTGLRLSDIWRYFRHTWVNEYKSVPGRSISILIRDASAPNHAVIGIAALGSSVAQHKLRDKWIGWHPESIEANFGEAVSSELVRWLLRSLQRLINDLYVQDLLKEGLVRSDLIKNPDREIVKGLLIESDSAMAEHRKEPQRISHAQQKASNHSAAFWGKEAETFLYRAKRCRQLSKLLEIRRIFQEHGVTARKPDTVLRTKFESRKLISAVVQLVRMIKAEHMGIDMMDITVCGAIAPYNYLLGGKLVCMLLCSPEVTQHYAHRYSKQISVIASAMKGRPVIRSPKLVLLCTTSLYGVGSSQYNRVKIPLNNIGINSDEVVAYEDLGASQGYGTYHFSRITVELGTWLNARKKGGRRVNSIFGEGVNPLMRKIRESLDTVGMDSDALLQHGNQRVTYGIRLATNFREILLGKEMDARYLIPQQEPKRASGEIAAYWIRRWLSGRIKRIGVLDEIAENVLTHPRTHGAIVPIDRTVSE